jgi:glycosyltransferase involved in cell wall biosynthesis
VSTPYLYAEEVLSGGRGQLVPFADRDALADATIRYLKDPLFSAETRSKAYEYAKPMAWPNVGRRYLKLFSRTLRAAESRRERRSPQPLPSVIVTDSPTKIMRGEF